MPYAGMVIPSPSRTSRVARGLAAGQAPPPGAQEVDAVRIARQGDILLPEAGQQGVVEPAHGGGGIAIAQSGRQDPLIDVRQDGCQIGQAVMPRSTSSPAIHP